MEEVEAALSLIQSTVEPVGVAARHLEVGRLQEDDLLGARRRLPVAHVRSQHRACISTAVERIPGPVSVATVAARGGGCLLDRRALVVPAQQHRHDGGVLRQHDLFRPLPHLGSLRVLAAVVLDRLVLGRRRYSRDERMGQRQ